MEGRVPLWWITLKFFGGIWYLMMNYFEFFWDKLFWIEKNMDFAHLCENIHMWKCQNSQASWLLMRFIEILTWHNKIHTQWCKFWHHMAWPLKTFKKFIKYVFSIFVDLHIFVWKWTSLSVNLFVSSYSLHSDIFWHMTYSWYFLNIFWTSWHLLTSHLNHPQPVTGLFLCITGLFPLKWVFLGQHWLHNKA